mmetsp:Transcript_33824/g.54448  ORF Transcript_33824/g.54448 Transcript_33824/m.54448 type:complete len:200 (+) Transcript_33824:881-1480(+)
MDSKLRRQLPSGAVVIKRCFLHEISLDVDNLCHSNLIEILLQVHAAFPDLIVAVAVHAVSVIIVIIIVLLLIVIILKVLLRHRPSAATAAVATTRGAVVILLLRLLVLLPFLPDRATHHLDIIGISFIILLFLLSSFAVPLKLFGSWQWEIVPSILLLVIIVICTNFMPHFRILALFRFAISRALLSILRGYIVAVSLM